MLISHQSRFRLTWGFTLIAATLVFVIVLSYRMLWHVRSTDTLYWILIGCMGFDVVFEFTKKIKHGLRIIDSWRGIASHYLKRWFFLDFVAALPLEFLLPESTEESWALWTLRALPLLKAFKVAGVLADLQAELHLNPAIMRLTTFAYWFMQAIHLFAIGWCWVGGSPGSIETSASTSRWVVRDGAIHEIKTEAQTRVFTHREIYLRALYWTVTTVGTVGYGDYTPSKESNSQIAYAILIEIVGVSMYGYIVGNVSGLIANLDAAKAAFNKRTGEVRDFMRLKQLPAHMQTKVQDYYGYLWATRRNVDDRAILDDLPHNLAVDVLIHLNQRILQKVEFFRDAHESFTREIVKRLQMEVFLPGDYMMREGDIGDCMYFLSTGTAEVLVGDKRVATLGAGSPFGEMALIDGERRSASIVALEYCDAYRLPKHDFDDLRARHPNFDARVQEIVRQRRQQTAATTKS